MPQGKRGGLIVKTAKRIIFAVIAVLLSYELGLAGGPGYKGKTVNQWIEQLKKETKQNRVIPFGATSALEKMGPSAEAAIPVLIEALENEEIDSSERGNAAFALGGIGRAAVPGLIETLERGDETARAWAAYALNRIGPDAKSAISALARALDDEWWWARQNAAIALGRIGPDAKSAVPALKQALKDENEQVREAAKGSLQMIQGYN
jgi:HEAT repeat protein